MSSKYHLPGPGEAHALSTRDSEFLVLPLTGSCTVTTDGTAFELTGRTGVFASVTDFAYLPRESEALISSADGGRFALPSARTEHGFGYQRVNGTPERPIDVLAEVRSGDTVLIPHGWLPFEGLNER
ncbi:hypothetical protein AQI70_34965 [Streptomyces curacoi]|uniref:Uncharacterized protein n=1 Tax=Streptomyces curacoi TaxID=146536 RepID=A0A124GUQ6_9ACTN|nr:hypothetical protein AQI70_34965 [Streptomyces curacoi]